MLLSSQLESVQLFAICHKLKMSYKLITHSRQPISIWDFWHNSKFGYIGVCGAVYFAWISFYLFLQNEYQQHHPQGPQGMKKQSHRYTPYPYSGPKGHHQGGAGKKYPGKYQSSAEGTSSSGNYSGGFQLNAKLILFIT